MIADRLVTGLRERLGFACTKWSLVRIAIFAVAGLVIASMAVPARPGDLASAKYNPTLATDTTRNVALPLGDTRGFEPTARRGAFQIAWIGGSETLGVRPGHRAFIPRLVADRIGPVDGRTVSTDIYYLDAIRLTDELAALSAAVAKKPDLVVISLNPVWVLNDVAAQQWGYLDGTLARHSVWPPSRWPVAASLVSPGEVGWKALSWLSPSAVRDRYEWGVDLSRGTSGLTFLEVVPGSAPPTLTGLDLLAVRRPVDFFSDVDPSLKSAGRLATQSAILEREVRSKSSFNRRVLRQMFEVVRSAGVDAYFYVPPINSEVYADPRAAKSINKLQAMLTSATLGLTNEHVVFDPQGLQDRVRPTAYKDIIHVLDGTPQATVLAQDLCALLVARGKRPECGGP